MAETQIIEFYSEIRNKIHMPFPALTTMFAQLQQVPVIVILNIRHNSILVQNTIIRKTHN